MIYNIFLQYKNLFVYLNKAKFTLPIITSDYTTKPNTSKGGRFCCVTITSAGLSNEHE